MTLGKAVTGVRTRQAECAWEDGIPEGGRGWGDMAGVVQPWHVQGRRLEGWTGSEAAWGDQTGGKAYPKSTVHSLGGQNEVGEAPQSPWR